MFTSSHSNVDRAVDELLRTIKLINKYALVDLRCGTEDVTIVGGLLNLTFKFGGGKIHSFNKVPPGGACSLVLHQCVKKVQSQSGKHLAQEDGPAWDALPDSVQTLFGLAHRFKLPNGKQHIVHIPGYTSIDSSTLSLDAEPTIILRDYLKARHDGKLDRHEVETLASDATKQPNPAECMISRLMAVIEEVTEGTEGTEGTERTDESSAEESSEGKELSAAQTLVASAKTTPPVTQETTTQTTPALAGAEAIARQAAEQQAKWCESVSTLYTSCQAEVGAMEKALAEKKKELVAIGSIKDNLTPSTKKRGRGRPPGSTSKKTKPRA